MITQTASMPHANDPTLKAQLLGQSVTGLQREIDELERSAGGQELETRRRQLRIRMDQLNAVVRKAGLSGVPEVRMK